jgi:hypothetical protein
MNKCPKCGETELFQFTYDYSKAHRPVVNILCNNCGEMFPPALKLPKETPKQKTTLEEAAERYLQEWRLLNNIHLSNPIHAERCKNDFKAGAKWQAEKMYSEEEVLVKLYECLGHFAYQHNIVINGNEIDKWFEQFKKK